MYYLIYSLVANSIYKSWSFFFFTFKSKQINKLTENWVHLLRFVDEKCIQCIQILSVEKFHIL